MPKKSFGNLVIILSCLFIVLFVFLLDGKSSKREVQQNKLPLDLSGNIDYFKKVGYWHGENIQIPPYILNLEYKKVLSVVPREDRWIEVDLSDQKLTAWENGNVFLETLVSTGLPWWPTPQGEFYIWLKSRAVTMEGGEGKYYYNLPNVPYVMFFENEKVPRSKGYGLHGTYWHNDFGKVHSHGCVNLAPIDARWLYAFTAPHLPVGWTAVYPTRSELGTVVRVR